MFTFLHKNNTRHFTRRTWRSSRGFTALELMVALIISGIMIAATLPAFRTSFVGHRLKSAANQVQSTMRLTRARAIAEDVPYVIAMYPSTSTYYLVADENGNGTPDWGTEPQEGPINLPEGISLKNDLAQAFANNLIGFNPNGSALSSGILSVENERGDRMYIQLLQPSGMCDVLTQEEYDEL